MTVLLVEKARFAFLARLFDVLFVFIASGLLAVV
jgi:hypothetical protein